METDHVADGYCDDIANTDICYWDGGDCCGPNRVIDYCTECQCLSDGGLTGENVTLATTTPSLTTNSGGCSNPGWVVDDFCDDVTNNQECNFDGGRPARDQ